MARRLAGTVVLAGGRSLRMGRDKAFLSYCGKSFVEIVVGEASKVSEKVVVCIGSKDKGAFEACLPAGTVVLNDRVELGSPLSGALTGFEAVGAGYAALVGCDMPLIRGEVLAYLAELALGHSAAVPRWPSGELEPLLAVYRVEDALEAAGRALRDGRRGLKHISEYLVDVRFVDVSELRRFDPQLESLKNINTPQDYAELKAHESSCRSKEGAR